MKLTKTITPFLLLLLTLSNYPLQGIAHQNTEVMGSAQENEVEILVNQVAYNTKSNKEAIIKSDKILPTTLAFQIQNTVNDSVVFTSKIKKAEHVKDWSGEINYQKADFSSFQKAGTYRVVIKVQQKQYFSSTFKIGDDELTKIALPAIVSFFYHQRANSAQEQEADKHIKLFGSEKTVDLSGGWCDASGDVSKYFSHLAYTNFMLPQQIPMVTWAMVNTVENIPAFLKDIDAKENYTKEALYGADYLMRSLSADGYFYMTVFSYFDKDPNARRIVGLL
ncbi:MAG: glycoside hydrolase family 9 protein, partial [Pedobacter sp.]|nr:glycoside hydrolase family 9 protein [Pedobacter sp.]